MHGAEFGIEVGPAAVAVESHGETALVSGGAGALDAHDARFTAWSSHGIGLHHGVVLLVDPSLGTYVGAGQKLFEVCDEIAIFGQFRLHLDGRLFGNGSFPGADGAMVKRGIVSKGLVG